MISSQLPDEEEEHQQSIPPILEYNNHMIHKQQDL